MAVLVASCGERAMVLIEDVKTLHISEELLSIKYQ